MTFEEFFAKKKIDLIQLEKAEPNLFTEFKSHFIAMGEKSFDHTKKFWFNKLRRLYHLAPTPKAITQTKTAIASQAEPLSSPTIEQKPAFTPRFKSTNISKNEPASDEQATPKPVAMPAFKPRNIPSNTIEETSAETASQSATNPPPTKIPGFKPRNIKPAEEKSETMGNNPLEGQIQPATDPAPKRAPGFKPRNIKPASTESAADAQRTDSRPSQPTVSETPVTNPEKQEEAAKQGYKPKFKLKNIPRNPAGDGEQTGKPGKQEIMPESLPGIQTDAPAESDIERKISSSTEDITPEQEIQDNDFDLRGSDDEKPLDEVPKPAYKPKFNLKNIKNPNAGE